MTLRELASAIAKKEGKKSEARIGDIREILKILTDDAVEKGKAQGFIDVNIQFRGNASEMLVMNLFVQVLKAAEKKAAVKKAKR